MTRGYPLVNVYKTMWTSLLIMRKLAMSNITVDMFNSYTLPEGIWRLLLVLLIWRAAVDIHKPCRCAQQESTTIMLLSNWECCGTSCYHDICLYVFTRLGSPCFWFQQGTWWFLLLARLRQGDFMRFRKVINDSRFHIHVGSIQCHPTFDDTDCWFIHLLHSFRPKLNSQESSEV